MAYEIVSITKSVISCPPLAEVSRSDGGGYCKDCSPSSPKRRAWESRPTVKITAALTHPPLNLPRHAPGFAPARSRENFRGDTQQAHKVDE
jgi:hypothetical protein